MKPISLEPIGVVKSPWKNKGQAPKQGAEVRRPSILEIDRSWLPSLTGLEAGRYLWVICFYDLAELPQHRVHPRGDANRPQTGMFNTRTPNRPNPLSLNLVQLDRREGNRLFVTGLDAVNGTPVLDIKPFVPGVDQPPPEQRY